MQPEEVAEALIVAIEKRKKTLLLTGQGKLTNLMNKFFPKWLDKKVYDLLAKEDNSPLK
jgi:short-subunit dehydrogenase